MLNFISTEAQLTSYDLDRVERLTGLKWPNSYKQHLLSYNGGQCSPNVFSFYEDGRQMTSCVDWFLAIYNGEYDNLEIYIKWYKLDAQRIPARMLPIAHDPGGNLVCISCDTPDFGAVYFWDHEKEESYLIGGSESANLYKIADGFVAFLDSLKEATPDSRLS